MNKNGVKEKKKWVLKVHDDKEYSNMTFKAEGIHEIEAIIAEFEAFGDSKYTYTINRV
jgi:hypothetical protein